MIGFLMDRRVPLCWALMPQVLDRAQAFCEKYGSDTPAATMRKFLEQSFVLDLEDPNPAYRPRALAFVGLEGHAVVAHAVIMLQEFGGEFYAEVHQYAKDRAARIPPSEFAKCYRVFLAWAASMGVKDLRIVARNRAVAKVFEKRYGFSGERIVMRKAIWPAETIEVESQAPRVLTIAGRG